MKPLSLNAVTTSSAVFCLLPGRSSFLNLEKSMTGILKVFALAAAVASCLLVMMSLRVWLRAGMRSNVRRVSCLNSYMTVMMSYVRRPDPLSSDRRKILVEIRIWPPHIHLVRFKSSYLITWSAPGENNHLTHVLKMPKTNRQESPFRNYTIKNHMMTFLCSSTPSYSFHGSNSSHFKDSGWVKKSCRPTCVHSPPRQGGRTYHVPNYVTRFDHARINPFYIIGWQTDQLRQWKVALHLCDIWRW